MSNGTDPLWSTLDSPTRVAHIMKVVEAAAADNTNAIRNECLDPVNGQAAVARYAKVRFDADIVVRCFPDKETVEKQIVLVLPEDLYSDGKIKDYWLCTYVDYIPQNPLPAPQPPPSQNL